MRHLLKIFFIIITVSNMPYSQTATLRNVHKHPQIFSEIKTLSVVDEFSKNGELETFNAEVIKKVSKNTYWVKKAELLDNNNQIILELGTYLYSYGSKALNQVPAE